MTTIKQTIQFSFLALLLALSLNSFAQEKLEVEHHVAASKVPEKAKAFVCELFPNYRMKWIKETSGNKESFEAKVKFHKKRISIEFSVDGTFEDVEEELELDDLDANLVDAMKEQFVQDFERCKIKKMQRHYSGNKEEITKLYTNLKVDYSKISQLYELVVYGIKDKEIHSYEYTFSKDGTFVSRIKNAESNTDNLLF